MVDWLVFFAAFNYFSVTSRCFLGKLPIVLVHFPDTSQSVVTLTRNPERQEGQLLLPFLNWYDPAGVRTRDLPHWRRTLYHNITEAV